MRAIYQFTLLALIVITMNPLMANEKLTYTIIESPEEFIAEQKSAALASDKKILWILGSQWCHDSRSLEQKLQLTEMAPILDQHFQTALIDVSYLSQGFDFTEIAGMKTFYATPTVLIIDPNTMSLVNGEDMHIWSQAYKVSEQDTVAYFNRYTDDTGLKEAMNSDTYSDTQKALFKQLDAYVTKQERRIKSSYSVIGPMLKAYKDGKSDTNFDPYWNALAEVRMQLPKTIAENTAMIRALAENESAELILPPAKSLPWE